MMPALLSGALIVFVTSSGLFDVPLALASPRGIHTIPTQVFSLVQYPSDYGKASAVGVFVMVITIIFSMVQRSYMRRRNFTTVSGKGYRPRIVRLGRWSIAALAFELFYIASGVVLPMVALVLVSVSRLWTGWPDLTQFTLSNYDEILFHNDLARRAIINSLDNCGDGRNNRCRSEFSSILLLASWQKPTAAAIGCDIIAPTRHSGNYTWARHSHTANPHTVLRYPMDNAVSLRG